MGGIDLPGAPGPNEMARPDNAIDSAPPPDQGTGQDKLAQVARVRKFFPETWIWTERLLAGY